MISTSLFEISGMCATPCRWLKTRVNSPLLTFYNGPFPCDKRKGQLDLFFVLVVFNSLSFISLPPLESLNESLVEVRNFHLTKHSRIFPSVVMFFLPYFHFGKRWAKTKRTLYLLTIYSNETLRNNLMVCYFMFCFETSMFPVHLETDRIVSLFVSPFASLVVCRR